MRAVRNSRRDRSRSARLAEVVNSRVIHSLRLERTKKEVVLAFNHESSGWVLGVTRHGKESSRQLSVKLLSNSIDKTPCVLAGCKIRPGDSTIGGASFQVP